ncbi:MAG: HD family hydrolase [Alphaproteobacteria bacterium]|jgi:5'-deoxynucleotidase YfbR-like HD superfamily hydrolase|nr:HD family hydrolase [Alphaproteobacteria bacterium]
MESEPRQVAAKGREPPRAWQRMLSGRRLDLLNPAFTDIEIADIAHGLARVARWNGQTHGEHAFSVAQHSVLVEDLCASMQPDWGPSQRLMALLHDAPEYVVGDMISPFKAALGLDYRAFEERLAAAIHVRFGLPATTPAAVKAQIKKADRYSAYLEATQLAQFSQTEARGFFAEPPARLRRTLEPLAPSEAQAAFLARFAALQA